MLKKMNDVKVKNKNMEEVYDIKDEIKEMTPQ